jgi:hypothetical protein
MNKSIPLTREDRAICETRAAAPYVAASKMEAYRVSYELDSLFAERKVAKWVAAGIEYALEMEAYFA